MYTYRDYQDDTANHDDRLIPVERVRCEIEQHDACWLEFVAEFGEHASYSARGVLGWLGY